MKEKIIDLNKIVSLYWFSKEDQIKLIGSLILYKKISDKYVFDRTEAEKKYNNDMISVETAKLSFEYKLDDKFVYTKQSKSKEMFNEDKIANKFIKLAFIKIQEMNPKLKGLFFMNFNDTNDIADIVNWFCENKIENYSHFYNLYIRYMLQNDKDLMLMTQGMPLLFYKLLGNKYEDSKSIYLPSFGIGDLILENSDEISNELNFNYNINYSGYEINEFLYRICMIKIHLSDCYSGIFSLNNPIVQSRKDKSKYDISMTVTPIGLHLTEDDLRKIKPNEEEENYYLGCNSEHLYLNDCFEHLSNDGICICLVPNGLLYKNWHDMICRKMLIEYYNCVDAVINMGSLALHNTNAKFSIMILRKNKKDNNIKFINGEAYVNEELKGKRSIIPNEAINRIVNAYYGNDFNEEMCINITNDKLKDDYLLSVFEYLKPKKINKKSSSEIADEIGKLETELNDVNMSFKYHLDRITNYK